MPVRASDLPKAVRDRLGLSTTVPGASGGTPGKVRKPRDRGGPVKCHGCQEVFPHYGGRDGWEAHADATGHSRAEVSVERAE